MVLKTIDKKTNQTVKEELLNSIRKNDAVEEPRLNIDNVTDMGKANIVINS